MNVPRSPDELREILTALAKQLGEHCDSVRIFCTLPTEGGNSTSVDAGCGNLYAQLGQAQEWLTIQDQYARNWAIRKDAKDSDTDGNES